MTFCRIDGVLYETIFKKNHVIFVNMKNDNRYFFDSGETIPEVIKTIRRGEKLCKYSD